VNWLPVEITTNTIPISNSSDNVIDEQTGDENVDVIAIKSSTMHI